ncbi:MAG: pentapeptide repeat-containing protein [Candidatus Schekmanbacteria bacterium]|nr:pentapeptide repeat-containing protein [Candidatus Schekmanbacteria bacterium]
MSLTRNEILDKSKNGESLAKADLSGVDLRGINLRSVNLSEANLHWADLRKADLSEADLSGANLREANLRGAILQGTKLQGAFLEKTDLYLADLTRANLYKADLCQAKFCKATLCNTILSSAKLNNADFQEARMQGAILSKSDLSNANLGKANLFKADLRKADLRGTDLREANLNEADLRGTFLRWADLRGANLTSANLNETSLSFAHMYGANLSGAKLNEAKFIWTDLSGAILSGVDLAEAHLYETKLRREDLAGANYRQEQLNNIVIERPTRDPLIIPEQKAHLTIRLSKKDLSLLDFIYLAAFFEYYYDLLYIFFYNQYETVDKLKEILFKSSFLSPKGEPVNDLKGLFNVHPYYFLKGKDDACRLITTPSASSLSFTLIGLQAMWVGISTFISSVNNDNDADLYAHLRSALSELQAEKLIGDLLRAEVRNSYAELLKKCQSFENSLPFSPSAHEKPEIMPKQENKLKLIAFEPRKNLEPVPANPDNNFPRPDFLKTILIYRQEGVLTNKLNDCDLAFILDDLLKKFALEYQSICKHIGQIDVDILPVKGLQAVAVS